MWSMSGHFLSFTIPSTEFKNKKQKKKQLLTIHFSGKRFYISDNDNSRRLLRKPFQVLLNKKSFQSGSTCIQIVTTNRDFHKLLVNVKSCFLCRKVLEKNKRFCYPLPLFDLKQKYATCKTKRRISKHFCTIKTNIFTSNRKTTHQHQEPMAL